jgi:gluconolactonase
MTQIRTQIREIATGLKYPEGPVAMDDGSVIVTELQGGRLVRVQPDGSKEIVAETGERGRSWTRRHDVCV